MRNGYIAFVLDEESRTRVLQECGTKYPDVIAHHITLAFGIPEPDESIMNVLQSMMTVVAITEYVDNKHNIEALVVRINGTDIRADGNYYHLTLSLDRSKGAKPVHANQIITSNTRSKLYIPNITGTIEFISN